MLQQVVKNFKRIHWSCHTDFLLYTKQQIANDGHTLVGGLQHVVEKPGGVFSLQMPRFSYIYIYVVISLNLHNVYL